MSEIDPTIDLAHLANLARLNFDPNTTESARTDLEKIIAMIDVMQDVDTEGVAPLSHPLDGAQRLRQDLINETEQREKFQHTAPAKAEGYYLVPRVVN
jgi:aspartyl-tRNA(Asn)/glutamyl-tRNA(Gln) amidotransferase subunit C